MTTEDFQVSGENSTAPFMLILYRGDGMALIAMNWKDEEPPQDFVGFAAVEYKEPGGAEFFPLKNRLGFPGASGEIDSSILSTRLSPIQKFRWVHFPRNAELPGEFVYRLTRNPHDEFRGVRSLGLARLPLPPALTLAHSVLRRKGRAEPQAQERGIGRG